MSDICLYASTEPDDPISAGIRLRTQCRQSHVGFIRLSDKQTFSAKCDGRGVAWRSLSPTEEVLLLTVIGADAALSKALTQEGKDYDLLNIAGLATGFDWHSSNHWICCALVFWAFEQIGAPLLNPTFIPRIHLTPRDVLLSPYVTEYKPEVISA